MFTVDEATRITSFNRAAERITGYAAAEVLGRRCAEVFRTSLCDTVCPLRVSIRSGQPVRDREVYLTHKDGRAVPAGIATAPLFTRDGRLLGGVEVFEDRSGIVALERVLTERFRLADIIGRSPAMRQLFDVLPAVAAASATVLLTGPSGTGKELVARTIHSLGPRAERPFVAVNCASIPETLFEAELFGHTRGAFTDARHERAGRVSAAEGGTLLLDEVGDLPRAMQAKMLRFLQERTYEPLGSDRTVRADVRVLASTHRDLDAMAARGEFRQDLLFRLDVVRLELPPLRDRPEDVPLLLDHFVRVHRGRSGRRIGGFTDEALARLVAWPWPGNVRELENVVERAFVLCAGERIGVEHLPPHLTGARAPAAPGHDEEARLRDALEQAGGNRTRAAEILGVHRVTLLRRMRRLGIR